MLKFVESTPQGRLKLLTEFAMGDNLASHSPDREILRTCSIRCPQMNEITLDQSLDSLRRLQYPVEVPRDIASRARIAMDRMIAG